MSAETDYMYLFIRQDLSQQQQIIQASHAAAKIADKYHGETSIVLCGAKDVEHLYEISEYLGGFNIDHSIFYEPDVLTHTAIATRPLKGSARNPMRKFNLL